MINAKKPVVKGAVRLSKAVAQNIVNDLCTLWDSCQEGYIEAWDCTTEEGREGFCDMQEQIESILLNMGVKPPGYTGLIV